MNSLYRFLRYAALMALIMAWIMPAMAQHPFALTTTDDVTNHTETLYWIESFGANGFYAISHTDNSSVSTTNMPNLKALWYFMDAGTDNSIQYYYIVNHNTGYYLKHEGTAGEINTIKIASFGSGGDDFRFSIGGSEGQWVLYPKSADGHCVNKKGGNVSYTNYLKSSTSIDANSKWNFVARNSVTWAHPFTNSTNNEKQYYLIHNATSNGAAYYMSIDDASDPYATVSNNNNNKRIWYFMEAASDNTIPNLKYYYIVNAVTGKYLKFTGTANGSLQANSLQLFVHNGTETGDTENRFQFMVLNAKGDSYSAYSIMPKLEISYYNDKFTSLSPGNANGNAYSGNNAITLSNDMKIGIYKDRGQNNNYAHWLFDPTDFVLVEAPTITNNFDGTITLSTATPGATIYYTTNGDTPNNTSTEYTESFSLGDATVIKAIAYVGEESSEVTTYNVPQYTTPTITFDNSNSEVTITCAGATSIYYTTDGSTPTTSSTTYSIPFTVDPGTTVKAIATHAGYLNSDVATKYILSNNYSQNYLTFNVISSGTICWKSFGSLTKTISYRINGGSWTEITSTSAGATFDVNEDDVVEFKGSNTTYATSNSAYSGFEGGTATFDIEGNIHSLLYEDDFADNNSLTNSTYQFCSLFKKSLVISAENLVLPATTLKNYCYRALFSWCTTLEKAPVLPATTLATGCYWYMFEQCAISSAPELNATTLVQECYGHMFEGCGSLNYVKCMATSGFDKSNCLLNWVLNVSSTGTFVKETNTTWSSGASGIPSNWTIYNDYLLYSPEISCDGEYITITCATEGASIYYRLNQTGNFSLYSSPIFVNTNTTVEAYSTKGNNTSNTVIYTFEIFANPFDESTRSLDTWTYGNAQVTLPYSVNGIDGHSSSYSKGTHTFETTITLYKVQPTYLWFQHADQSADIYVDDVKVTTHWGGYNAFFVDISDYVHQGTNRIKVILDNTTRSVLAPFDGDFNFNATLGKVKLLTSPVVPSLNYGYDGFHITSSVTAASGTTEASATINIKTSIPIGASVICKIDADDENYHFRDTLASTGEEMTFTTTIPNPHLWNGIEDPFLYNVTLEIYHNNELYHRYERPYGFRYYEYVINEPVAGVNYTGFLLNGLPYLLRGVCMHSDLEGKANALDDNDIANDFAIIQDLGCNFVRLAHYPHPKEVYDWCDRLGIIVQTEVPCVNKFQSTITPDYYSHLYIQYEDMVRQHFNHPCIMFWGLGNEIKTDNTSFAKDKLEAYKAYIKAIDTERWVGYVVDHNKDNPYSSFGGPNMDWFGCNIYVGWYIDKSSNNPTNRLDTRIGNIITNQVVKKPLAFSEYGCGGTQHCHSDNPQETTTKGNYARHDIEYQMWLHEGHIAAIKKKPELLFTSQWQLFDIAVSSRNEGYTVCIDGEHTSTDDNLRYLNNKGLVERDHKTKKDTYYLYKAWWNQKDKFVHICGKDYEKLTSRVIKCYTNDTTKNCNELSLHVNGELIETAQVDTNIVTFTARNFNPGDVIRVDGATTHDAFSFTNDFITDGNWNEPANWRSNAVPAAGSDVVINAACTIPATHTAQANIITIGENGSLTIADGGQLVSNSAVNATVEKNITAYTIEHTNGVNKANGWHFIASPVNESDFTPGNVDNMLCNDYDLYRLNPSTITWENYKNSEHSDFTSLVNGQGYLYANSNDVTLSFTGTIKPYDATYTVGGTGWNLVGNPYTFNAYVNQSHYTLNDTRDAIVAATSNSAEIAPCTGVVVEGNATFHKETVSQSNNNGYIQLAVAQQAVNRGTATTIDNAIVSFNEGNELDKFYFGTPNANIYIPQNGKDYAIVNVGRDGVYTVSTKDVNFKANENGQYTITISPENVEMGYLHLIDNMTGVDVNLLQTPEYTFSAKTMDSESRFKLVFVACNNEDGASSDLETFAFFSNGNWIIANEGQATLQVIDLTGRILSSETVNGCVSKSINVASGIYLFRLVNGNDAKVQKVVVR